MDSEDWRRLRDTATTLKPLDKTGRRHGWTAVSVCASFAALALVFAQLRDHFHSPQSVRTQATIRASMRLASVLPKLQALREKIASLRGQAAGLGEQIDDVVRMMHNIRAAGERLRHETSRLSDARARLAVLEETKHRKFAEGQLDLAKLRLRQAASEALSLKEGHDRLDETERRSKELQSDLEQIALERERINAQLVDTGRLIQQSEAQLTLIESRLGELERSEKQLRSVLEERQRSISAVVSEMHRMRRAWFVQRA